jgi:hypothetical protein
MNIAILFWFSGILFTLGLNYRALCPEDTSFRHKLDKVANLLMYLLFAWPFFLGDTIRTLIEKEK